MRARQSVPAEPQFVTGLHDLTLWFLQCTNRYPKNWRISLGDRIDSLLIEMATQAQVARLRQNKLPLLTELSDKIEVLRVLTRLSVALHCLSEKQYAYVAEQIDGLGRQLGGWIKQQRAKS